MIKIELNLASFWGPGAFENHAKVGLECITKTRCEISHHNATATTEEHVKNNKTANTAILKKHYKIQGSDAVSTCGCKR